MEPWLQYVLSSFGGIAIMIAGRISSSLEEIRKGQNELNLKLAVVIEQVQGHDKRITKLEGDD